MSGIPYNQAPVKAGDSSCSRQKSANAARSSCLLACVNGSELKMVIPVERYTPERKAEFLLSNAIDQADYRKARKEVRKLGLDPDTISHRRPV
jgi:hypothetical protein